ncbi:MAG: acetylglutamate kinase [Gemmatimonadetes bacterium]|nr:MAG: acetylglutamate kinase [Gemmatimonadota bacterium]
MLSVRVVKLGGNELDRPAWLEACARGLLPLDPVVVVHGGGRAVSAWSERLGLPVGKRDGLRVTTLAVAEVVELVLGGPVNRRVVAALRGAGLDAVGLSGVDGGLLTARPVREAGRAVLGHVGTIAQVRGALLESFLLAGLTPVIAPMAPEGGNGSATPLNVNADEAAAAIAGALRATELLLVSDVPGVQVDGLVQPVLDGADVDSLIEGGEASDGMAVKLRAAAAALRAGARAVRIGDLRLLDDARAGTRILATTAQPA